MKKLTYLFIFLPIIASAQYSNYYQVNTNSKVDANVNVNANINKNVNVTGTISTIDYGALANANAQREANRISKLNYANQRAKDAAIAIANDPSKAYDYGIDNNWKLDSKSKKAFGWDKKMKYMYHKIPNNSLFVKVGDGYTYGNTSNDGVKTEIIIYAPSTLKKIRETNPNFKPDFEEMMQYKEGKVGETFKNIQNNNTSTIAMLHKKDIKRANIAGNSGFRGTAVWEDRYEKCITDNYGSYAFINKETYVFQAKVSYKGDVDEVSFEQLEGRRYYFKALIDKMLSTIKIY